MRMYLIRHSITYGNTLGRYIGTTDEPLCQEGVELLQKKIYPGVDAVYASPLKRCTETAEIIYPENRYISLRIWQNATSGFSRIKTIWNWMETPNISAGLTAGNTAVSRR